MEWNGGQLYNMIQWLLNYHTNTIFLFFRFPVMHRWLLLIILIRFWHTKLLLYQILKIQPAYYSFGFLVCINYQITCANMNVHVTPTFLDYLVMHNNETNPVLWLWRWRWRWLWYIYGTDYRRFGGIEIIHVS